MGGGRGGRGGEREDILLIIIPLVKNALRRRSKTVPVFGSLLRQTTTSPAMLNLLKPLSVGLGWNMVL